MLAVVAADGASLDAGSVALALARRWSDSGESVLFVDADASGSRLAERFGQAENADYSPAVRGMASLIVAREPLTLKPLADHCYSLDTSAGSLWALFAPLHPSGAAHAARWIADRRDDLVAVDAQRRVVVSSSLRAAREHLAPVLSVAPVVAVVAPAESTEQAKALWAQCRDAGLRGPGSGQRVVIVEGDPPLGDEEIGVEAGMRVAGRLPVIDDERILRLQGGRRDRALAKSLDTIAARLLALSSHVAAAAAHTRADAPTTALDQHGVEHPGQASTVNGARSGPSPARRVPEARREGRV